MHPSELTSVTGATLRAPGDGSSFSFCCMPRIEETGGDGGRLTSSARSSRETLWCVIWEVYCSSDALVLSAAPIPLAPSPDGRLSPEAVGTCT